MVQLCIFSLKKKFGSCSFRTVWPIFTICLVLKNETERSNGYINKWPLYSGPCPHCCPSRKKKTGKCPGTSRCPTGWPLSLQRTWLLSIRSLSGDLEQQRIRARCLWNPDAHKLQVFLGFFLVQILTEIGLVCGSQGKAASLSTVRHTLRTELKLYAPRRCFDCSHGGTCSF